MNNTQIKNFIDAQVESTIEQLFLTVHGAAMTNSGDITPGQQNKLDQIKEDLKQLVTEQVIINMNAPEQAPEQQERIWKVPVCRTGFASKTIEVIAATEEEAIEKAIDEAGNYEFSENDAEYSTPDGAF